ncbi:MAG: 30S ribosomal protein S20 [bacterium]|nr:30S ribosomal protein S20 [bacterium]
MAHGISSKKRIRQNLTRSTRNHARKQRLKTEVRKFNTAIHDRKVDDATAALVSVTKLLDQTAAKGTIHRNVASRRKSRLAKRLNKLGAAES